MTGISDTPGLPGRAAPDVEAVLTQQSILARFGDVVVGSDDLGEILAEGCRAAADALGVGMVRILEWQDGRRTLLLAAGIGWEPGAAGQVRVDAVPGRYAAATDRPVVCADTLHGGSSVTTRVPPEHGIRSFLNVAIAGGPRREPYGVLEVDSRMPRQFGSADVAALRGLAALLAAAIARLRAGVDASAARDSEARLGAIFDAAPIGIIVCEAPSGRVVSGNPAAERVFRRPILQASVRESPVEWALFHLNGRPVLGREHPLTRAMLGERHATLEVQVQFRDGSRGWILLRAAPLRDAAGSVTGAILTAEDIDLHKRAAALLQRSNTTLEADAETSARTLAQTSRDLVAEIGNRQVAEGMVRQLQKMEVVGQLTGGIAHDFNNMLAVVISGLNLVQRRIARGDHDVTRFVDAALNGAMRAGALTQRLLAFSRQQAPSPVPLDPNKLLNGMDDMLHRTLGGAVLVQTVLEPQLWMVHADPGQLENAVLNLVVNGRDAMAGAGTLTIETANVELDDLDASAHDEVAAGQYVMIAVTDTGSGMTPDVMARVFDPYFTTKAADKGTGLGLSQVYGFVRQSAGHIKLSSDPGRGTSARIYLPRFYGEAASPLRAEALALPDPGSRDQLVLVVEDEARVRDLTVASIRELGYTAIHADSATAALRQLDEHPDLTLLFTDVVMPDMNGRQLAEAALRRRPGLKVLFTTGYTLDAILHNGILEPDMHLLLKPFSLDQLAVKLHEVIGAD